ncbi:hypothetical protein A6P39_007905 [Streptomyces sp. FXJ1.172]|uniref:hypothetical protein n=1 Tax=Streptomyces sp. FXJ1.172 TaxID=710705 RepID=UPI000B308B38|nr:hypothetical protein [Streptomyces sp. FXJ1.172]WEO93943.1 hypothetical protein A6P39_007905 [Streptomyces sp. FXJ1.172]
MRNQHVLAAVCAAVAVLGFAAPRAVADGVGQGNGGVSDSGRGLGPGGDGSGGGFGIRGHDDASGRRAVGDRDDCDCSGGDDGRNGGRAGDRGSRAGSGPWNIVARPSVVASGARLRVTVDGCRGGAVSSRGFPRTWIVPFRDDASRGSVAVDRDARPGRYGITVHCDGRTLTRPAAFTVLGAVKAGAGGAGTAGATTTDMAIGAGLVGSAVTGSGVYWLRRRKEKRIYEDAVASRIIR